jgi:8-oxo-dGTP diphosphatase
VQAHIFRQLLYKGIAQNQFFTPLGDALMAQFVGGQLHGESLPETLLRECFEELGVKVRNLGLKFIREYVGKVGESAWRDAGVHQVEFLYECALATGEEPQGGMHRDHSQVGIDWLPIESLAAYRFYPKKLTQYLSHALPDQIEYWGKVD